MTDFLKDLAYDNITQHLDTLGVPGDGLNWARVQLYAESYHKLTKAKPVKDPRTFELSDDQKSAWTKLQTWAINDKPYFVLRGYAGAGKEQPLWTKVQTPAGVKTFGNLKIGDEIYGKNGKLTKVTAVYPQGRKPFYKITFRDRVSTYCGIDHLWNVFDKKGKNRILTTQQLIDSGLSNSAGYKFSVPLCEPVAYEKKKLPIHPYVLGVLLGNGCLMGDNAVPRISCAAYDTFVMKKVKTLEPEFTYTRRLTSENCFEYNIRDNEYRNRMKIALKELGLWGMSSRNKFIPKTYLLSSIEDRKALLAGLLDTDGSASQNGGGRYSTYSTRLMKGIRRLVQSLGGLAMLDPSSKKHDEYSVNISMLFNPFTLPRKVKRYMVHKSRFNKPKRAITKIEYMGETEQQCITVAAKDHLYLTDHFIVTHNTFLLQLMKDLDIELMFTAPTNKATKVLGNAVTAKASTTFSALGIKMAQNEDGLELKFSDTPPHIPKGTVLVIDESSMVGEILYDFIVETQDRTDCKVLFVGDPAQLPPVGELRSKTWQATKDLSCRAFLKQIMRYDNELLKLATDIRTCIEDQDFHVQIKNNNNGEEGVFVHKNITTPILKFKNPADWQSRKIIAWRNKTVNNYNEMLRENFGFNERFNVGDILLLAEPIEEDGNIVASIDEEFSVVDVHKDARTVEHRGNTYSVPVWRLEAKGDVDQILYIAINDSNVDKILSEKAGDARSAQPSAKRAAWRDFWETKSLFHKVRYGYALTAHRAQGSTYSEVFLDRRDILLNQNKKEAWRCLYVAATRATTSIHTF